MSTRLKIAYELYNFFHKKELVHNVPLYEKYGLKKKYYSSISSKDFKGIATGQGAPITAKQKDIQDLPFYQGLNQEAQRSIDGFEDNGYCIIRNFWSAEEVATVNGEINRLVQEKVLDYQYNHKLMFAIHKSDILRSQCRNPSFEDLLDRLIGGKAHLFQSINFTQGSEQKTHSDSIHMTTFPLGGLLGVWIALEPIGTDNGPVHYYPKSHKLPYYLNADYDNEGSRWQIGDKSYAAYEQMMEKVVEKSGLQKQVFTAEAGDLFIWHANMLHGGEPHLNKDRTRKSMVLHYFDADRICYHEITQRPALFKDHAAR